MCKGVGFELAKPFNRKKTNVYTTMYDGRRDVVWLRECFKCVYDPAYVCGRYRSCAAPLQYMHNMH